MFNFRIFTPCTTWHYYYYHIILLFRITEQKICCMHSATNTQWHTWHAVAMSICCACTTLATIFSVQSLATSSRACQAIRVTVVQKLTSLLLEQPLKTLATETYGFEPLRLHDVTLVCRLIDSPNCGPLGEDCTFDSSPWRWQTVTGHVEFAQGLVCSSAAVR